MLGYSYLFDRYVVGWSMDSSMIRKLVMDAFNSAIWKENPEEGFIFHSNRGVQYASYDYQNLLKDKVWVLKDVFMIMLMKNHSSHL